jgi:hypothetical protein
MVSAKGYCDAFPFRPTFSVWGPCLLWVVKRAAVDQSVPPHGVASVEYCL